MTRKPAPSPRILVFDDDLIHHPTFLAGLPATFVYRGNANDAVADVESVAPDGVLMDFSMGRGLNGAAAVKLLRTRWDFDALPIIGISSVHACNLQMKMAGATDAMVKMAVRERFEEILAWL
jgi:CheY-like chemotaxis protein